MVELKAHCKINLGLRVIRRREDGFHDIETVMIGVPGLFDMVSVAAMPTPQTFTAATPLPYPSPWGVFPNHSVLEVTGNQVDCPPEQNVCMRSLRLMQREFGIGEAAMKLHKNVPSGAGLGGGSADAAAVLRAVNQEFALELTDLQLENFAAELGSDVPFFLRHGAQFCTGRGEVMASAKMASLEGLWLAIAKPEASVSTAEAYAGIVPREGGPTPAEIVQRPVGEWRENLRNDFEITILARHPEIAAIKHSMYGAGAVYASMSGSGSAVFGLFKTLPQGLDAPFLHVERL